MRVFYISPLLDWKTWTHWVIILRRCRHGHATLGSARTPPVGSTRNHDVTALVTQTHSGPQQRKRLISTREICHLDRKNCDFHRAAVSTIPPYIGWRAGTVPHNKDLQKQHVTIAKFYLTLPRFEYSTACTPTATAEFLYSSTRVQFKQRYV